MDNATMIMILKMSAMTALYVLLTISIWMKVRKNGIGRLSRVIIGLVYGLYCVLSTHFGVDYGHMLLNVRDAGPLAAGIFFHPVSGVIAGLIGGIERYIAGTFWQVGSYSRVACSVSTCLAGFLSVFVNVFILKRKKPSAIYAFFVGAVMEVFHMYAVFITHRNDIMMAYYVVKVCAAPMILFTACGLAACSVVLQIISGEWSNPMRRRDKSETPISLRFQRWLIVVTTSVLLVNFTISFAVQTQIALSNGEDTLTDVADDIVDTYNDVQETWKSIVEYSETVALTNAEVIGRTLARLDITSVDTGALLDRLLDAFDVESITLISPEGKALFQAGKAPVMSALFEDVLIGSRKRQSVSLSIHRVAACVSSPVGMVQVTIDPEHLAEEMKLNGINDTLSHFHVGRDGTFDIFQKSGLIIAGTHRYETLSLNDSTTISRHAEENMFIDTLFKKRSMCRVDHIEDGSMLVVTLPLSEVYATRDSQIYEIALADILLFAAIYMLVSVLVQMIVVNNLQLVNASLSRITNGDLNEVVDVRKSSEFTSLSDDINQTVTALKGYIAAAEHRMEQELQFAATIQDSALPRNFSFPRDDIELFATMDPAKEVGGDFYDFFFVHGGKLALVIADVSGKGIPAALFMMRSKTAIRGLAESGNAPSEIFYKANITLCDGNDAEMFVTAWIGIIDLDTGHMICASAGHEYPVLMRKDGEYELMKDPHGLALAAMPGAKYRDYDIQLNSGDKLFVYTDGIPEAINENMEQYGCERLIRKLNAMKHNSMKELLPAVRDDISDFTGNAEQFDDITMLGFAYFGSAADSESAAL